MRSRGHTYGHLHAHPASQTSSNTQTHAKQHATHRQDLLDDRLVLLPGSGVRHLQPPKHDVVPVQVLVGVERDGKLVGAPAWVCGLFCLVGVSMCCMRVFLNVLFL